MQARPGVDRREGVQKSMTPEERATAVCRDSRWTIEPWKYDLIVAAIRAAIAEEREACAEIADYTAARLFEHTYGSIASESIAAAIRARGGNP
jgi:hypothetical protein